MKEKKNSPNFTGGKWSIEKHGNGLALFARNNDWEHGHNLMYIQEPDWNFENNKRLIEAAPDLYRELEQLVNILDSLGSYIDIEKPKKLLQQICCGEENKEKR
jgi:hypothetical protein